MAKQKTSRTKRRTKPPVARSLDLSQLAAGVPHLSRIHCQSLAEAASVALADRQHEPGVQLKVDGSFECEYAVSWATVTPEAKRSWGDIDEAVEDGAMALAIIHTQDLTRFHVIERSYKGPGFDYWLGRKNDKLFQRRARLEISGIRAGSESDIETRVKKKLSQIDRSSDFGLPGFVVVVEFGSPRSRMVKR